MCITRKKMRKTKNASIHACSISQGIGHTQHTKGIFLCCTTLGHQGMLFVRKFFYYYLLPKFHPHPDKTPEKLLIYQPHQAQQIETAAPAAPHSQWWLRLKLKLSRWPLTNLSDMRYRKRVDYSETGLAVARRRGDLRMCHQLTSSCFHTPNWSPQMHCK